MGRADDGVLLQVLVVRCQLGDRGAFAQMVSVCQPRLRARGAAEQAALAEWRNHRRLSPFEAVQWKGTTPQVQVRGKWYELVSMDGLSSAQIVARCQALDERHWQKRFEEDLVEVLMRTGHPIGDRTMLEVKDLETGQVRVLMDVPLTRENRDAVWRAASTRPSTEP